MFGLFERSSFWIRSAVFSLCLFQAFAWAQMQKAQIVTQGALLYTEPDFDATPLGALQAGDVVDVSTQRYGAFYFAKTKIGQQGYISDVDVKLAKGAIQQGGQLTPSEAPRIASKSEKKIDRRPPFEETRFVGLSYDFIRYSEDTMGKSYSEPYDFFGIKFTGPNLLLGIMPVDIHLRFTNQVPTYYQKNTGQPVESLITISDIKFMSFWPQSSWHMLFLGFGPTVRYSRFDVKYNGKSYPLEDVGVGAAFNVGIAFRWGKFALRTEADYFWEKSKYSSAGASLQYAF